MLKGPAKAKRNVRLLEDEERKRLPGLAKLGAFPPPLCNDTPTPLMNSPLRLNPAFSNLNLILYLSECPRLLALSYSYFVMRPTPPLASSTASL